jgi:hypothetical protein
MVLERLEMRLGLGTGKAHFNIALNEFWPICAVLGCAPDAAPIGMLGCGPIPFEVGIAPGAPRRRGMPPLVGGVGSAARRDGNILSRQRRRHIRNARAILKGEPDHVDHSGDR